MKTIAFFCLCAVLAGCQVKQEPKRVPVDALPKPAVCISPNYTGKMKVAVIIYDGVEVVDMNGPIDVFTKANYVRDHYYVYTVAAKDTIVYTENCNTAILPRYTIYNCPSPDIVILPGSVTNVWTGLLADSNFNNTVLKWVKELGADTNKDVMSVCTGGMLLGKTGLLDGKKGTTHYLALEQMKSMYPKIDVVGDVRYVADKNIISTAGITSGIDGALYLVEKYDGKMIADSAAHIMVYNRNCPMR